MSTSIGTMILSAGASTRMEQPKGLLRLGAKSFLQHCVDESIASGIRDTVIVLGAGYEVIERSLAWYEGRVVVNAKWEDGQLSSIIAGIGAMEGRGHSGILIWPVDHPLISASLIAGLVHAFEASCAPIVVPSYRGKRGHPILLSHTVHDEVRSAPAGAGLRSVVHAHAGEICEVRTDEEGVLINIDTPEEYRRYVTMGSV